MVKAPKEKGKGKGYHNHLNYHNPVDWAWQDDESQWWLAQYYEDDAWSAWSGSWDGSWDGSEAGSASGKDKEPEEEEGGLGGIELLQLSAQ